LARSAVWDASGTNHLLARRLGTESSADAGEITRRAWRLAYGTYLTHVLVLSAIGRIIHALTQPGATSSVALIAIGFLAANLVGAFVFRFFERPTLTLLHRFGSMPKARSKCMEKRLLPEISSGRI
jgi:peptidoglycan/LPS O-acetylase OafA/YrhL